ncbi:MAG: SMP-30/gluconolactonase/LRE family protein [Prolixibacteraceae bacterium]|nr:SMP-30/gluconolactonase/LRE family protein [Prolixibacteraceae bacterium]
MQAPKVFKLIMVITIALSCQQKPGSIVAKKAQLIRQSDEFTFTEGPTTDKNGNVYFTDQPSNRIIRWNTDDGFTVFMENAGRSNGLFFLNETELLACADEKNELWLINTETKEIKILVDNFEGKKLNGPNDMWVDKSGGIYFTDPYYERDYWENPEQVIEKQNVYYLTPGFSQVLVADSQLVQPNGIIGTPDGKTLYVADIGDKKTYRYTINGKGLLTNRTLFCNMGSDGMTIDEQGNVYLTGDGVTVFDKNGKQIMHIPNKENWTANVTFGGKENKTLFITAMGAIYTLEMNVKGVR